MSSPTPTDNNSNNHGTNHNLSLATNTIESSAVEATHGDPESLVLSDRSLFDNDDSLDDEEEAEGGEDESRPKKSPNDSTDDASTNNPSTDNEPTDMTVQGGFSFAADTSPLLESFVQQANRVQVLVSKAWQAPQCLKRTREAAAEEEKEEPLPQRRRLQTDIIVEKIAQEKTQEVVALQRKLQGLETEFSTLQSTNDNLRQEVSVSQRRYERVAEALRLSQRNASQARADADAAENTSNNLSQTLQNLKQIVQETQDASRHLQAAHDEIQQKATAIQADLWQKEVHIACVEKEYNTLAAEFQKMERAEMSWKREKTQLEELVEEKERTIGSHERQLQERRTIDEARRQRVQRLEEEWRQAQQLLVEATAAQATAAEIQSQLRSDLRTLQQKNEDFYRRVSQLQEKSRQEQERHNEALQQAEKDGHQWHIQLETCQDHNERLQLEKTGLEKQISQLKAQLAVKTASETDYPNHSVSPEADKTDGLSSATTTPSANRNKENNDNSLCFAASVTPGGCVICGKAAFGLMKKCQCGKCDLRAHLPCVRHIDKHVGLSVAHPGTPYPPAPFLLCSVTSPVSSKDQPGF
eukprot:scaffold5383_cov222-Amphora_coffeaeformis.AAC.25